MEIRDLDKCALSGRYYGGDGGTKYGIIIDNKPWMVKFPKDTTGMERVNIPYTTTPASEYIGSQVYGVLGVDVHRTILGYRHGKVVVACKDFLGNGDTLVEFKSIKNAYGADVGGASTSGSSVDLGEVVKTIRKDIALHRLEQYPSLLLKCIASDNYV